MDRVRALECYCGEQWHDVSVLERGQIGDEAKSGRRGGPDWPRRRFGGVAGRVHVLVASAMRLMLPVSSGRLLWLLKAKTYVVEVSPTARSRQDYKFRSYLD